MDRFDPTQCAREHDMSIRLIDERKEAMYIIYVTKREQCQPWRCHNNAKVRPYSS